MPNGSEGINKCIVSTPAQLIELKKQYTTVGIIIDNHNLIGTIRSALADQNLSGKIDWIKMVNYFLGDRGILTYARLYSAERFSSDNFKSFTGFMAYNGIELVTKTAKSFAGESGETFYKCNFDVEIAVDTMDLIARCLAPDKLVFITGDSDFAYLAKRIKQEKEKIRVEAASFYRALSTELKEAVDYYHFIENIWTKIKMDPDTETKKRES
jgi:uncharacterized LabA/DUF88 family protein